MEERTNHGFAASCLMWSELSIHGQDSKLVNMLDSSISLG